MQSTGDTQMNKVPCQPLELFNAAGGWPCSDTVPLSADKRCSERAEPEVRAVSPEEGTSEQN